MSQHNSEKLEQLKQFLLTVFRGYTILVGDYSLVEAFRVHMEDITVIEDEKLPLIHWIRWQLAVVSPDDGTLVAVFDQVWDEWAVRSCSYTKNIGYGDSLELMEDVDGVCRELGFSYFQYHQYDDISHLQSLACSILASENSSHYEEFVYVEDEDAERQPEVMHYTDCHPDTVEASSTETDKNDFVYNDWSRDTIVSSESFVEAEGAEFFLGHVAGRAINRQRRPISREYETHLDKVAVGQSSTQKPPSAAYRASGRRGK